MRCLAAPPAAGMPPQRDFIAPMCYQVMWRVAKIRQGLEHEDLQLYFCATRRHPATAPERDLCPNGRAGATAVWSSRLRARKTTGPGAGVTPLAFD